MPPFWKSLLGGSSSSSSSSSSASTAIPGVSSSNSSNSISNSSNNNSASPSTSTSSLSSPRKGQSSTAASAARPSSSSSLSSSTAASNGSRQQQQPQAQAQPQPSIARSSPIVIPGNSPHTHAHAPVSTSAASGGAAGSNAGIPISQQTTHQHSTSIASSSALSSSTSYADDTDDASIPETPYSTGHSPSHARHKFPQDSSNHHTHHGSNGKQADGRQGGGRTDSSGSGADTNDDDADTYLSDDEDEDSQGDPKQPQAGSKMGTSFASMSSSTTSSSSGVPNARQSPLKPDIPTTHTILANPLPQPSSGLAAAISSVLPSSSSSSNTNNSSNGSSSTAANIASPNGKAGAGSAAAASAAGGTASDTAGPRTFDIDDMISRLLETGYSGKISKSVSLKNSEITALCLAAREVFLSQPTLLELSPPVNIVGDVHGQYSDLIRLFEMCSFPPQANYLFLGDYVDRGKQSLETILLLLCYKVKYPENFFLLRGNHECANVTRVYGFYDECKRRCNLKIWKTFVDVFNCLPIAALVAGKIFCVHGGLSPSLSSMDDIRRISRPTDVPDYGLLNDLLWSDPSDTALDWEDNERGVSYCFGKAVIQEFLAKYDFDLICRAHMVVEDGYEFWNDRTLVTIFSAPNYCGEFDNFASSMLVNEDLLCSFELLKPLDGAALKKELAKCRKKNSAGLLLPRPTA